MVKNKNTEETILESAREIFIKKGFDGARMQEIADHAGINKALLHYYYRNKENLFAAIFENTLRQISPHIMDLFNDEIPLEVKVWKFVDNYIELIRKYPRLPLFILNEINVNPGRILEYLKFTDLVEFDKLEKQLSEEHKKGNIIKVDVKHFIVNILSLTIFPFAGKLIIRKNLQIDDRAWEEFIEERKKVIPETIMNWIRTH